MNFDNYLFRAHSIGKMMAGVPKVLTPTQVNTLESYTQRLAGVGRPLTDNQKETLGDLLKKKNAKCKLTTGAETFLNQLVWEEITGRREEIQSKYIDKGLACEEHSLTLYSNIKSRLILKNKERKNNAFFTGECDIARYKVRDIKTSWSYSTFPLTTTKMPSKLYGWQLDVYMDLFKYKRSELIYCLVDTPTELIEDELRRLHWKYGLYDGNGNIYEQQIDFVVQVISNLIFTFKGLEDFCKQSGSVKLDWFAENFKQLPEEIRVKIFKQNYCEKRNKQLKEMVALARAYMNKVLLKIGEDAIELNNYKLKQTS